MNTLLRQWMAWEGGVDLVAATQPNLPMPNVIVHVARVVHTPVGSAPAGMIFFQPDPTQAPAVMGFISSDPKVAAYFGPAIFAGTPFEQAPKLDAKIEIDSGSGYAGATVAVGGFIFKTKLVGLKPLTLVSRAPAPMAPFWQQGAEAAATTAQFWVNGAEVSVLVPPVGISGGPAAVSAPFGSYAR